MLKYFVFLFFPFFHGAWLNHAAYFSSVVDLLPSLPLFEMNFFLILIFLLWFRNLFF